MHATNGNAGAGRMDNDVESDAWRLHISQSSTCKCATLCYKRQVVMIK